MTEEDRFLLVACASDPIDLDTSEQLKNAKGESVSLRGRDYGFGKEDELQREKERRAGERERKRERERERERERGRQRHSLIGADRL